MMPPRLRSSLPVQSQSPHHDPSPSWHFPREPHPPPGVESSRYHAYTYRTYISLSEIHRYPNSSFRLVHLNSSSSAVPKQTRPTKSDVRQRRQRPRLSEILTSSHTHCQFTSRQVIRLDARPHPSKRRASWTRGRLRACVCHGNPDF